MFLLKMYYVSKFSFCLCVCVPHVCSAHRGQKRVSEVLELQTVVAVLWVLGPEPWSSARVASAWNY